MSGEELYAREKECKNLNMFRIIALLLSIFMGILTIIWWFYKKTNIGFIGSGSIIWWFLQEN